MSPMLLFTCMCSNNIDDIAQVEFLALCRHLTRLTFDGNPICVAANTSSADVSYFWWPWHSLILLSWCL